MPGLPGNGHAMPDSVRSPFPLEPEACRYVRAIETSDKQNAG